MRTTLQKSFMIEKDDFILAQSSVLMRDKGEVISMSNPRIA